MRYNEEYSYNDLMGDCVGSILSSCKELNDYGTYTEGVIDTYMRFKWDGKDSSYLITLIGAIDMLIDDNIAQCEEVIRLCEGDINQIAIEQQYYEKRLNILTTIKNELCEYLDDCVEEFY